MKDSRIQTGLPRAPANWATLVSDGDDEIHLLDEGGHLGEVLYRVAKTS